jgi:hypothetical protein
MKSKTISLDNQSCFSMSTQSTNPFLFLNSPKGHHWLFISGLHPQKKILQQSMANEKS